MKIAVQISGEFRMLQRCWPNFEQYVLRGFPTQDIDIFLHTWRKEDNPEDPSISGHGAGLALFQPRSYFLDSLDDRPDLAELPRSYTMFCSIHRANECRKHYEGLLETKYDLVMRYRTDCHFQESIWKLIEPYVRERKSFLCIPRSSLSPEADGPTGEDSVCEAVCDWFAIGTADAMDVYCGTYETWRPSGLPILPESMLAIQLKSRGITQETILKRPLFAFDLMNADGTLRSKRV